jgi:Sugar (and other) transporter
MTISAAKYTETQVQAAGNALLLMLVLYGFTYSVAWSGLLVVYAVEIFPHYLRSRGVAIIFFYVDAALFLITMSIPLRWKLSCSGQFNELS